jgi:hypothetical protein
MARRKREMLRRMPILRQHDITKARGETVDDRHNFVAVRHRQCAARTKIVLHVDDDQHVSGADILLCKRAWRRLRPFP